METNLIVTCGIAFVAVIGILAFLAVLIRLIAALFPDASPESDEGLMTALEKAVGEAFPGARVIGVEVEK